MPIPDFQSLMLPALKALSKGRETPVSKVRERIAADEGLAPDDLQEMLPSGRQSVFANRVSWAVKYLERAGLTERVRRGVWRLTTEGRELLKGTPSRIDVNFLGKYPAFVEWRTGRNAASSDDDSASVSITRSSGSTRTISIRKPCNSCPSWNEFRARAALIDEEPDDY